MPTARRQPIQVRMSSSGVFVLESHHAPDFRMAEQRHDFLEVFYVLQGVGEFRIDGRSHPCRTSEVVVVPLGHSHRIEDHPGAPLALYGICVAPQVWQHERDLLEHVPAGKLPITTVLAAQVRDDLRRLLFEQTSARLGSRVLMLGLTMQILAHLARSCAGQHGQEMKQNRVNEYRGRVESYIAELPRRFFEASDLDHTAAELGISRRRFTQLFREITGKTWSDYLVQMRIDYACRLLGESERGITAVAFECGFEDLSSFYRAFKRGTGLTPSAWRQAQKRERESPSD